MSLPNDIIEKILLMKEIYIVIRYDPCYEFSTWNILGIFNNLKDAQHKIIDYFLEKNINEKLYDPTKRFELRKRGIFEEQEYWSDSWEYTIGVSDYRIETWRPNEEKSINTLNFNIDSYIKNHIIKEKLSSEQVTDLFNSWRQSKDYEKFIELFSDKKDINCAKINKEDWYASLNF